jgi:uncharacterized protein YuzE
VRVELDPEIDAAYIYLVEIGPGDVHRTYACDPQSVARFINLDFNASKWLIGIEVWECASKRLPPALLRDAQILGDEDVISPGSQCEAELETIR